MLTSVKQLESDPPDNQSRIVYLRCQDCGGSGKNSREHIDGRVCDGCDGHGLRPTEYTFNRAHRVWVQWRRIRWDEVEY